MITFTQEKINFVKKEINKYWTAFDEVSKDKVLIKSSNGRQEFFLVSKEVFEMFKRIPKSRHPYCLGMFIGHVKKKEFIPSLNLLQEISGLTDKNKVIVNEKAEKLFTYGRDVFFSSMLNKPELKNGELVIVANQNNEALGLGKVLQKEIKNILDIGFYFRGQV